VPESIRRVDIYGYELHYAHGEYVMSGNRATRALASTLVRITTEGGLEGWGETCPLGATYLPAFAEGARAALRELAPALIGVDALNLGRVREAMDNTLAGHGYAKSPVDIACHDVLGRATRLPVCALLGGRVQESFPLYEAVPHTGPDAMAEFVERRREHGIHRFQLKIGGDPARDAARVEAVSNLTDDRDLLVADANGGYSFAQALDAARLLERFEGLRLEQPCRTLAECIRLRPLTRLPLVYDEVVHDVESLLAAAGPGGASAVNLKLAKVGGLTPARRLRDLALELGLQVTIEDTWGGDVTTAAVSHLAASTPAHGLFTCSFFNDWTTDHVAGHLPRSQHGRGSAPQGPGLGIEVDVERLGAPLFTIS
jgi:L-alanine-DL-glutamate epimerase-like enolase superfamily enzyme